MSRGKDDDTGSWYVEDWEETNDFEVINHEPWSESTFAVWPEDIDEEFDDDRSKIDSWFDQILVEEEGNEEYVSGSVVKDIIAEVREDFCKEIDQLVGDAKHHHASLVKKLEKSKECDDVGKSVDQEDKQDEMQFFFDQ